MMERRGEEMRERRGDDGDERRCRFKPFEFNIGNNILENNKNLS